MSDAIVTQSIKFSGYINKIISLTNFLNKKNNKLEKRVQKSSEMAQIGNETHGRPSPIRARSNLGRQIWP